MRREYRAVTGLELRQSSGKGVTINGYAAVFNELSEDMGFRERILPGAFTKSLGNDVRALVGHDPDKILGRTRSKTLKLSEDDRGLYVEIDPPDTQLGHDTVESIKRGDLGEMSIGFYKVKDRWTVENREDIRELVDLDLFDVSVVAFPAYKQTSVSVRSVFFPDGMPEDLETRFNVPVKSAARLLVEELERRFGLPRK